MAFKDIPGNERVKKILRKSLKSDRVPNSMLFCGMEGVGKTDVALVLAKAMNCERKKDDACEGCESCKSINGKNFPDVIVILPEKNAIKINQMRILKQLAYLRPMVAKKRVFIVVEAEKMTEEAANSLLKVLEEPPLFSYIILITHNPSLIISTIQSRCQIMNFSPISKEDIERILVEKGYEDDKARIISLLVRGNLKQALDLEWEEVQAERKQALHLFLALLGKENVAFYLRNFTSSPRSLAKKELEYIFEILSSFCRDLILISEKSNAHLLMNPDYEEEMVKMLELVSREQIMDFLKKIEYIIYGLYKNLNVNLLMTSFFSNFKEWEYV